MWTLVRLVTSYLGLDGVSPGAAWQWREAWVTLHRVRAAAFRVGTSWSLILPLLREQ